MIGTSRHRPSILQLIPEAARWEGDIADWISYKRARESRMQEMSSARGVGSGRGDGEPHFSGKVSVLKRMPTSEDRASNTSTNPRKHTLSDGLSAKNCRLS